MKTSAVRASRRPAIRGSIASLEAERSGQGVARRCATSSMNIGTRISSEQG